MFGNVFHMPHWTNTVPVHLATSAERVHPSETRANEFQNAIKVTHIGQLERPWHAADGADATVGEIARGSAASAVALFSRSEVAEDPYAGEEVDTPVVDIALGSEESAVTLEVTSPVAVDPCKSTLVVAPVAVEAVGLEE